MGLSGSDLHQLCSHAAARPVLELARSPDMGPYVRPRPLAAEDFDSALGLFTQRAKAQQRSAGGQCLSEHVPLGGLPDGRTNGRAS